MITIEIPEATPSNNLIMRMHHRMRTAEHQRMTYLVREAVGPRKTPLQRCEVSVIRYGERALDWDNMGGGLKFLFDAMVKTRIIEDDNPSCVTRVNLHQEKCRRAEEKTIVLVEDKN